MAACLLCASMADSATSEITPTLATVYAYTTVRGDTLIGLGNRLLIDPSRWPDIARANAIRNPNRIGAGTVLKVPLQLMRSVPEPATVVSVVGQAATNATPLQSGQSIAEGSDVTTGPDGNITIRLVDGTLLRLRSQSALQIDESRRLPAANATRSGTRLDRGRIEVEAAPAKAGLPGFRISTPQGVLGVRGTEFRVDTDSASSMTRGEVLGGKVAFGGSAKSATQVVIAGQGSVIDSTGAVSAPVSLLGKLDVSGLPLLQEQVLMRFTLPPLTRAAAYRGQIARDTAFDAVIADLTSPTAELRFGDLPDGDYVLRVRAIDAHGLEGLDADHRFRLKARPEAPLPSSPAPGAVLFDGHVEFTWAANAEAATYRFQLSHGDDFETPIRDLPGLTGQSTTIDGLPVGRFRWRARSVRVDGDAGPWGAARSFEIRPPPPVPPPPKVGDKSMSFAWPGSPGQNFEFQVARNVAFTAGLVALELDRPEVDMPLPGSGRFYVRLRVRDADGFIGPWTAPQSIDLPNCLRDGSGACVQGGSGPLTLTF